jgi:uncharacterized protein YjbI with pentapeptide repeats
MSAARGTIDRDSLRAHDEWVRRKRQGEGRLDVAGADATGVDLHGTTLVGARLERVDLRKAMLDYADLTEAELTRCNFEHAGINSTHFDDARITECGFEGATGAIAKLDRATIYSARFDRARMHTSQWVGANVTATTFANTELENANLDRATFVDCDFRGARLGPRTENPPPSMRGAKFENCDFRDADFTHANIDGATFTGCKFAGARGEPRSVANMTVTGADVGDRDQLLAVLAQSLSVDAVLKAPGPLVVARDGADPARLAIFRVDPAARLLTRVPVGSADRLRGLRQGACYGNSAAVWSWDDDSFTIWNFAGKQLEARGQSLVLPGGSLDRAEVTRVASFIGQTLGNRGVKLLTPRYKYERIVIVQDLDFRADDDRSYTRADARRDGMWASHVGRDLAAWLCVPHDDEFA